MNIKISKEEHEYLRLRTTHTFIVGSRLYGTHREDSDTDILCIYDDTHMMSISPPLCEYLPNYHQFQYDDKENSRQYIYTTWEKFYKNLFSGDSTINADVVMFYPTVTLNSLKYCRTSKVIKAFIGLANRDLKNLKGNKLFHAHRSLYCAEMLLNNILPRIDDIQVISKKLESPNKLVKLSKEFRDLCNTLYERGDLESYYIPALPKSRLPYNTLMNKLIRSNNTKEFRYE